MLKELMRKLKSVSVEAVGFDPKELDDPVALEADWGPAKGGGANFRTHRLVEVNPYRVEFRATRGALFFYSIFLVVGLVTFVGFTSAALLADGGPRAPEWVPIVIGLFFAGAGGAMIWFGAAPIVFDKRRDEYWKGRTAPYEAANRGALTNYAELERIHALQLIAERCRSDKSTYYSYELNLVLDDGSRLNVTDHGDRSALRRDADALGAFLDKPVWDASSRYG